MFLHPVCILGAELDLSVTNSGGYSVPLSSLHFILSPKWPMAQPDLPAVELFRGKFQTFSKILTNNLVHKFLSNSQPRPRAAFAFEGDCSLGSTSPSKVFAVAVAPADFRGLVFTMKKGLFLT